MARRNACGKPPLNIVLRDIEPGNPTSIEPAMRAFAERGYDLIIGVGFAQAPIMEQVAKEYPNIRFAIVDGVSELPNVASLVFKEHEGSYLVGMLAAKTTRQERSVLSAAWTFASSTALNSVMKKARKQSIPTFVLFKTTSASRMLPGTIRGKERNCPRANRQRS